MTAKLVIWGLILLWVGGLTVNDWRTRRVPNWAVYPLLPVALITAWVWPLQGPYGWTEALYLGLGVMGCGAIWFMRLLSGGDIKLAFPLVILLPYAGFYLAFLAVGLIGSLLLLIALDGGRGWRRLQTLALTAWMSQRLPGPQETREQSGRSQPPATWMLGIPTILFSGWHLLAQWMSSAS